jgi:hypothetical protein
MAKAHEIIITHSHEPDPEKCLYAFLLLVGVPEHEARQIIERRAREKEVIESGGSVEGKPS